VKDNALNYLTKHDLHEIKARVGNAHAWPVFAIYVVQPEKKWLFVYILTNRIN